MPRAKLVVSVPEELWIHEVSTAWPEVTFRVISLLTAPSGAVGVIEVAASNPVPVLSAAAECEDVRELELLWKRGDAALLQIEATNPALLAPTVRAGVPLETPFEIRDGEATWELTTSGGRLSELGNQLEEGGISYRIEYVRDVDGDRDDDPLTDRQREVFLLALEEGYYDVPRRTTLTEVADVLDVSKATCSDVLHRAEGKIARQFAEEVVGPQA